MPAGIWRHQGVLIAMQDDERAIRSVITAWIEATSRGDTDAVLALMTDDVVFLVPGQPPMDKAAFESAARSQSLAKSQFHAVSDVQEILIEGTMGYVRSHLAVTVTPPGSAEPVRRSGHTVTIFRKVDGRWLLARDANLLART